MTSKCPIRKGPPVYYKLVSFLLARALTLSSNNSYTLSYPEPLHHRLHRRNRPYPHMLNRQRCHAIREIHSVAWVTMPMKMYKEGGGEDISSSGGVNFVGGIGGEAFGNAMLEEGSAMATVGGHEQGNLHAPPGEDGIGIGATAVGKWEQVFVAENEDVEKWQNFFSGSP